MIKIYTLEQSNEWDKIVKSFKDFDVYYLSSYVKAFKIHGDGEPILIFYQSGDTRAINVVIKRDISKVEVFKERLESDNWYDILTPYGYGGFLVEGTNIEGLQNEYITFCKEKNIVCEFVRFHPILRNWDYLDDLYSPIKLGETVYIDCKDVDGIWDSFSSKNRNMIRKAQKNGLSVFWGRDSKLIDIFIEIYNATMDKDNATEYYYFKKEFYESILYDLRHNSMWFYVKSDNVIVAIAIFMFANGKMHYHLSASRREYQSFAPTNLLIFEAALWASSNGYESIHLGGGVGAGHDNLYKFKKSFNRNEDKEFFVGKRIFNIDEYNKLVELRKTVDDSFNENTKFFPAYRG